MKGLVPVVFLGSSAFLCGCETIKSVSMMVLDTASLLVGEELAKDAQGDAYVAGTYTKTELDRRERAQACEAAKERAEWNFFEKWKMQGYVADVPMNCLSHLASSTLVVSRCSVPVKAYAVDQSGEVIRLGIIEPGDLFADEVGEGGSMMACGLDSDKVDPENGVCLTFDYDEAVDRNIIYSCD